MSTQRSVSCGVNTEAICSCKTKLGRILSKMRHFRPKLTKIKVLTFWMSKKMTDSRRRPTQQASLVNPHQRCGYSDSPFAMIHCFYTAGSRNGLEGLDLVYPGSQKHKKKSPNPQKGIRLKSSKSQNGFADHPSPILKRPHTIISIWPC